ncbi:MAG: N-acetyl-gamma-glutamyl-phosphate reductase [Acidobacteria bacterium]|nr:MAG: N-acetyl-gamma-glutamyl-phosphate reductase [Acidobacteriota bacterium]
MTEAETFSAPGKHAGSSRVVRVAVAGATGYAGLELLRLLGRHPYARVTRLMSSGRDGRKEFPIEHSHPSLRGKFSVLCQPLSVEALPPSDVDIVFLATPHQTALEITPRLLERHLRVVDLSAAFRLKDASVYPRWYGFEHNAQAELEEAVYGLTEMNSARIAKARLVANPGCYAASVILALAPAMKKGWVDIEAGIISDSKSGASGAGRGVNEKLHFVEVNENCRAYGLFNHRHVPEMLQELYLAEKDFVFTPHLLPITRGILSTIYIRLSRSRTHEEAVALYRDFYAGAPFVRVLGAGVPEIQSVAQTNYADIGFSLDTDGRRMIIVSALDNLTKGAAGQAIQNMNVMYGFAEETALT